MKSRLYRHFVLCVILWGLTCTACMVWGCMRAAEKEQARQEEQRAAVQFESALVETPAETPGSQSGEAGPPAEAGTGEELNLRAMKQIENATLTHYCICQKCCSKTPEHPAYGITASGREAEPYKSIAVDPFLIPLGSTVYINYGDGVLREYRADDTGSSVVGARLDLCVESHEKALELGVKTVQVFWEEPTN